MSGSILQATSLEGTKWLVTANARDFTPYFITFNSGGKAKMKTVNGCFHGDAHWSGFNNHVQWQGKFNVNGSISFMGSITGAQGCGHNSLGIQLGQFNMTEQHG